MYGPIHPKITVGAKDPMASIKAQPKDCLFSRCQGASKAYNNSCYGGFYKAQQTL